MTKRTIQTLAGRIGGFPIELPAAALFGAAAAFLAFIAPDWRIESLVRATGVASVVPAAAPPLGETARLLVAALSGTLAFLAAWLFLRALDRDLPVREGYPAFRKADLHPDAPRRRPILAGEEFGAPDDSFLLDRPAAEVMAPAPDMGPLPSFLAPEAEGRLARSEAYVDTESEGEAEAYPVVEQAYGPAELEPVSKVDPLPPAVVEARFPPTPDSEIPSEGNVTDLMGRLESALARRGDAPAVPGPQNQAALREVLDELNQTLGRRG